MSNGAALNISQSTFLIALDETEEVTFRSIGANTYPAGLVLARDTTDDKLVPYVAAGPNGTGTPTFVLLKEIVAVGTEDFPTWVMTEGATKEALTLVWTGGSPVIPTPAERDTLRAYGILVKPVTEMNFFDNALP